MNFEPISLWVLLVFLLDVFLAGMAQSTLSLGLTAATALLGVLLSVCKIVVCHRWNGNNG